MNYFLFFILLTFSQFTFSSQAVFEAYKDFYHSQNIDFIKCGLNIQKFLQYLKSKNVRYQSGYVVSLHEPFKELVHYDARWGTRKKYKNGVEHQQTSWYFHVFLVIDDFVYDFSQMGPKRQYLRDYIETAYLPKFPVDLFLSKNIDRQKTILKSVNVDFYIYDIVDYRENLGPAIYQSNFFEYIRFAFNTPMKSSMNKHSKVDINFETYQTNRDHSVSFYYPSINIENKKFPLLSNPIHICRSLGFLGVVPSHSLYEVSDKVRIVKLTSSMKPTQSIEFHSDYDTSINVDYFETIGAAPNQPLFHYSKVVRCTDLLRLFSRS